MKQFTRYAGAPLDETYESVNSPLEFKRGITLKEHQKTVVAALLDAERNPVVRFDVNTDISTYPTVLQSNATVLSEPFGSGKTYEVLALIMISPIPPAFPMYIQDKNNSTKNKVFSTRITKRFIGKKALIKPTLIIVGSAVLDQWVNVVSRFTHLYLLRVADHKGMKKLKGAYEDGTLNGYDVVILKNGKVGGSFARISQDTFTPGGIPESLITVVSTFTANSCWSRVVMDDYDTISIPSKTKTINALSTIYVSATRRRGKNAGKSWPASNALTVLDYLGTNRAELWAAQRDENLFDLFNVRNSQQYIDNCINMTLINFMRAVYKNPNEDLIRMIGNMEDGQAHEIMQMLNGDAVQTAAGVLGIVSTSIADIFEKMLDKKYDAYINSKRIVETVKRLAPMVKSRPFGNIDHKRIAELIVGNRIVPENELCNSDELLKTLKNLYMYHADSVAKNGKEINRVISNVKEGMCQICCSPLTDCAVFIVKCCGNILCEGCGVKGCSLVNRKNSITGTCATCKKPINSAKDLILVDKTVNIEALITATGNEKAVSTSIEPVAIEPVAIEPVEANPLNPKIQALIDIIEGRRPQGEQPHEVVIPKLLTGTMDIPMAVNYPRKVLVFASEDETLQNIEDILRERGIIYDRLRGTTRQMAQILANFREKGKVLIINSSQYCAGVNVEFCTDLVFFHKLIEVGVEAQVIGRAQRIGRQANLNVHYLMYENEVRIVGR